MTSRGDLKGHQRRNTGSLALLLAGMMARVSLLHIFSPNSKANSLSVALPLGLRYHFNVDSGGFVYCVAAFPQSLAREEVKSRRARPLYPALGSLFLSPAEALCWLLPDKAIGRTEALMREPGRAPLW